METRPNFPPSPLSQKDDGEKSVSIRPVVCDRKKLTTKTAILIVAGIAHVFATLLLVAPGYLSVDEGICHWMVKTFHDNGALALWNGYEEFPSPTLVHPFIKAYQGHLYSPYPYLFAVLATPWYHVAGFFGLFLLNSLCFVGTVAVSFLAARRLFDNTDLALNACLILIFATFAWEYSQAAWAHSTATFFVVTSFCLAVYAYFPRQQSQAWAMALASGIVAGLAAGIRVDAILVVPGIVLPFLFARPWRPVQAALVLVGTIPGLLALSATNLVKFGVFGPLSYGEVAPEPVPSHSVILVALIVALAAWILSRERYAPAFHRHRIAILLSAAVAALCALAFMPALRGFMEELLRGGHISLIDIRALDWDTALSGTGRTRGGGVVSVWSHRKALLQSMPYLTILLLPIVDIVRSRDRYNALLMLLLVPSAVIAYHSYAFLRLDGAGLVLNARYLVVCLPFLAILSAYTIQRLPLLWGEPPGLKGLVATGVLTVVVFVLLTVMLASGQARLEFPLLVAPLLMASLLFVLTASGEFLPLSRLRLLAKTSWVVLGVALTWAGLVAFLYDYPSHRIWRVTHRFVAEELFRVIPDDCVVFAAAATHPPCVRLIEKKHVRIALIRMDHLDDLSRLVEFHLKKHRRAFGFLDQERWERVAEDLSKRFTITPVLTFDSRPGAPGYVLAEVSRAPITEKKSQPAASRQ